VPVRSHWQIPELHGDADLAERWNSVKRTTLVLVHDQATCCASGWSSGVR
jgi:hypothetical protein